MVSYAKINIGLKIVEKTESGFHNIETIFYPISLSDDLNIRIERANKNTNSVIIHSDNRILPTDRTNICFKVIEKFFRTFGIKDFYVITISIKKKIPIGGGLGGGSTNAATMLKYLLNYFRIDVNTHRKEILDVALDTGSDVPFFLIHKPCFAEGRGEKMHMLKEFTLEKYNILLVNPNLHISTGWAFERLNYSIGEKHQSSLSTVTCFDETNLSVFENDFEKIIFEKFIILDSIKNELLNSGAVFASMSGSGATLYGLFDKSKPEPLQKMFNEYKQKNYFVFISS